MDKIPAQIAKTLVDTFNAFNGTKNEFDSSFKSGANYIILNGKVHEDRLYISFAIADVGRGVLGDGPCYYVGQPSDTIHLSDVTAMVMQDLDNAHHYLTVETETSTFKVRTEDKA